MEEVELFNEYEVIDLQWHFDHYADPFIFHLDELHHLLLTLSDLQTDGC